MVENIISLLVLILLETVLGFDNLLYISLEAKNAPPEKQKITRQVGLAMAIILRIVLLFVVLKVIELFENPIINFDYHAISGHFTIHSLIVLVGGGFIIYTATKEIWHMISFEEHAADGIKTKQKSFAQVFGMILLMNFVFSFDSVLSAIALTHVFWVMAVAILVSGLLMIWLSDTVATFLAKNRMYEVLGLFVLFLIGIMLLSEGGHLAHLTFFGHEITPLSKATFYFVLVVLIIVDVVQGRYQKKIALEKKQKLAKH